MSDAHTGDLTEHGRPADAPATTSYRGPAHAGAPRLSDLDGVETVEVADDHDVLEQERYDTADLRLAAAGITLAVHRLPGSAHWQLTLPDGDPSEALRLPLAAPDVEGVDPDTVPEQIDALLRGVRRDEPVAPVGRIRVVRTTSRLRDLSGQEIVTLALDGVQVSTLGASTSVENWSEAEVTAGRGAGAALLGELDTRLRDTGLIPAPHGARDALAAMLAELAPAAPQRWSGKKGAAGTVLLDYVARHADRLVARERGLREDEPDAVHRMRVASRRIRSALRTFSRVLEGPRVDHLVTELQWLGRALADDRDAEVIRDRIGSALDELPPELVLGPVRAQVTRHFARRQAEARAAVLETVDGPRYAALQGALARLLIDPPLSPAARRPAAKVMPAMVGKTAAKLGKRMDAAVRGSTGTATGTDEALHRARRTGKQLRYATEVVRPVVGRQAKAFAKALEELQDELGAHQDAVVARETLRELGAQAGAENQNGFTFGLLYGRDLGRARRVESTVPRVWERTWDRRLRRWMR